MEIPDSRVQRVAVRYLTCKATARRMSVSAGREARKMHDEARLLEEIAMSLLGPDEWAAALTRAASANVANAALSGSHFTLTR